MSNFAKDIKKLAGYTNWVSQKGYCLDKDTKIPGNKVYSRSAYISLARVLTYGAQKYGPNNWQGVEPDRYIEALLRHLVLFLDEPEGADAKSGLLHIEHVLCNAMVLNHLSGQKAKEDR